MVEILKAVSEAGLVAVLEGPLVMATQRCSPHVQDNLIVPDFGLCF